MKKKRPQESRPTPEEFTRIRGTAGARDRQMEIHRLLHLEWKNPPADGKYWNSARLAERFGVTSKTINRDIAEMRDRRGMPIDTLRGGRGGHRYTEEVTEFPGLEFSQGELYLLVLGIRALAAQQGRASEKTMRTLIEKLFSMLDEGIVSSLKRLESLMTFRPGGFEARVELDVMEALTKALLDQEQVTFIHTKPEPGAQPQLRHVQPRHLASIDGNWYVFTDDLGREGEERHFALSRINAVKLTGTRFKPMKPFDLEKRLNHSIGVHTSGKPQPIRLRFSPSVRTFVLEREWHRTEQLTANADGSVDLTFKAPVNEELQRFVFRWGADVQVIGPGKLREAIEADARRLLACYAPA